ncbi:MAG: TonB-dependent receptor [Flavobacteriales bacterium]
MQLTRFLILLIFFIYNASSNAQLKYTLSGYVKDAETGEVLIGSSILIKDLSKGVTTNAYGFYSITLPEGTYQVRYSYIGYQEVNKTISLSKDVRMNIELSSSSKVMEEVVITGERNDKNTTGTQMGTFELEMDQIKKLPAFMGEVDILKTIQFMPGVSSSGEGNTGFYVRGGGPDQNLILLDEATVYNASHLFGFFSVFNADAIKNVEMIKGGMPANYGGRLASVLDIGMKEGNYKEYKVDGGVGLIASRLTVQGPIKKDTSSFIISARRTYIDVLTKPLIKPTSPFRGSGYYFYDLNTKINWRLSDKDRLFVSGYFGRDVFSFKNNDLGFNVRIPWGNATGSARWNHLFNDKLFVNTTLIFSDYDFAFEAIQDDFEMILSSGIRDWNFKSDFTWFPNPRHNIKFGYNYIFHRFTPSSVSAKQGETVFDVGEVQRIYANEGALYVLDEYAVNEKFSVNVGLRYSMFQQIGPFTRYYVNDINNQVDSTKTYERAENVKFYQGLEPRAAMRYLFKDNSSVKAGVTHNYQYVHLASISGVSLPTDVWFPSSEIVKPQIGTQYSVGYFRNFKENKYEGSVEVYYKDLKNLIEYKEGVSPGDDINNNVDNQLTFGDGYSYGAEFFIKKRHGRFNGWIGYTWSKTMRLFEEINDGNWFPAKYDRRHDLSVILQYELSDRWSFGGVFVYATGNAATLPERRYFWEGELLVIYGERNSYRLPAYHRADVSATYFGKKHEEYKDVETGEMKKRPKRFTSDWNFSVFNLYNRQNPYFIYFGNTGNLQEGNLKVNAYQVSLFPILPSVTWNFSF